MIYFPTRVCTDRSKAVSLLQFFFVRVSVVLCVAFFWLFFSPSLLSLVHQKRLCFVVVVFSG